jgi:hypothetical protein
VAEILLQHIRVTAIADYYDVAELKEIATAKVKRVLETTWPVARFSDVVKEGFDATKGFIASHAISGKPSH